MRKGCKVIGCVIVVVVSVVVVVVIVVVVVVVVHKISPDIDFYESL